MKNLQELNPGLKCSELNPNTSLSRFVSDLSPSALFCYANNYFGINNVISCLFNFYLIPKISSYRKKYQ